VSKKLKGSGIASILGTTRAMPHFFCLKLQTQAPHSTPPAISISFKSESIVDWRRSSNQDNEDGIRSGFDGASPAWARRGIYIFFQLFPFARTKINANNIYITVLELDMERPGKQMFRYVLRVRLSFLLSFNS